MTTISDSIGSAAAHLSEYLARMCCRSWALSEEKRKIPKTDSPETEFSTRNRSQLSAGGYFLLFEYGSSQLPTRDWNQTAVNNRLLQCAPGLPVCFRENHARLKAVYLKQRCSASSQSLAQCCHRHPCSNKELHGDASKSGRHRPESP
jgi:hypothetical protein